MRRLAAHLMLICPVIVQIGCYCGKPMHETRSPLKPIPETIRSLPIVVETSTFGTSAPDYLREGELARLLALKMPEPRRVLAGVSLINVIEEVSHRKIRWSVQQEDSEVITTIEKLMYRDAFSDQGPQLSVGDAINVLLGEAKRATNGAFFRDYEFDMFAVVCDRYLMIISLPVGSYGAQPLSNTVHWTRRCDLD